MFEDIIIPTKEEVIAHIVKTRNHSTHVEYYFSKLKGNVGKDDPQHPHDLEGPGNKYELPVIMGLALEERCKNREFCDIYIMPAVNIHRQGQYHHQKWNEPNLNSTPEDMKTGAVDAICSLLENRGYQGGAHTFKEIVPIIKTGSPHKNKWMWMVYSQMETISCPRLDLIQSLDNYPNIGIPEEVYQKIIEKVQETLVMLKEKGYS